MSLDMKNCRGQCYDGAGAMAGKVRGVAAGIASDYPDAHYTHCASHQLSDCASLSSATNSERDGHSQ